MADGAPRAATAALADAEGTAWATAAFDLQPAGTRDRAAQAASERGAHESAFTGRF